MLGILFSAFFILLVAGVPIAFAIGVATFIPLLLDGRLPFTLVITRMLGGMDSFPLMAIPFFVLTGTLATACNLVDRIMLLANFIVGRLRAGLAHVDIVTSMIFGGVSGSAVADCAATSSILIPSMTNRGYPASYAVGVCACALDDRRADPPKHSDDHLWLPDGSLYGPALPCRRAAGRAGRHSAHDHGLGAGLAR